MSFTNPQENPSRRGTTDRLGGGEMETENILRAGTFQNESAGMC